MQQISIFTTSACQRHCRECIMGPLMRSRPDYQLPLPDLWDFLRACEQSGYHFEFILTGGEPLLWKDLKLGVEWMRASSCCHALDIFTNALQIEALTDDVMARVREVRVSDYGNHQTRKSVLALMDRWPGKVRIADRTRFWANPAEPSRRKRILCLNPELMYFDGRIYGCPHALSIALGNHLPVEGLSVPAEPGFLDGALAIRRQRTDVCRLCISNQLVRNTAIRMDNRA